jgi:ribonuclease P protein component
MRLRTKEVAGGLVQGKVYHSTYLSMRATPTKEKSRFAVVVSKKISKRAVDRNRIRRLVYNSVHKILKEKVGEDKTQKTIFFVKKSILGVGIQDIIKDVRQILNS